MHRVAEMKNRAQLKEIVTDWGAVTLEEVKMQFMSPQAQNEKLISSQHTPSQQVHKLTTIIEEDQIISLKEKNTESVVEKNQKLMKKINKRLSHQKTKFLMSKYLPVEERHKRKASHQIITHNKNEERKMLKDIIDHNKKK